MSVPIYWCGWQRHLYDGLLILMKATHDLAVFGAYLPFGVKLMGFAVCFALMVVLHLVWLIATVLFSLPSRIPSSRNEEINEPKQTRYAFYE